MARVILFSVASFKKALRRMAKPQTHEVVTDYATTITLVPKTTSRHRHYITYSSNNEEEIKELAKEAEKLGYEVLEGYVQIQIIG